MIPGRLQLPLAFVTLCVANGRWSLAPAAWLAPLLLLLFIDSRPAGRGLGWAFLVQLLAFFVSWRGMIPVPGLWYYLVAGIYALTYFLPFVVHRLVVSRSPGLISLRSTLILPVSWVAIEFLFQKFVTPYGSWVSLAYTQVGFLPLIQLASVTGVAGIHFVMLWSAAVLSCAWREGRPFTRARTGLVSCSVVLLLLLAWGQWRIHSRPVDPPRIRVATLTPSAALTQRLQQDFGSLTDTSSLDASELEAITDAARRINEDLLERTLLHARGVDVVVWAEHAARVTRQTEPELVARAQTLARTLHAHLILGVGLWDPEGSPALENKVLMIDAQGNLAGNHHKARPIVGQEAGLIGAGESRLGIMETDVGRLGIAICHDLDFPDLVREAGRRKVDVLFGPSSDWEAITPLHGLMAIPRAVENGCALVRPCTNGLSLAVDAVGSTVVSQLDHGETGNAMVASLSRVRQRTPYPGLGDSFAYANLVALLLLLVARRRR